MGLNYGFETLKCCLLGIEPCAVGSTVEVLINPHHAARPELLEVTAYSPTNRPLGCPVSEDNGTFYASFQPDEAGEWRIHVTYDNEDIDHSPFKCMVFNPRAIFVSIKCINYTRSLLISKLLLRQGC